MIYFNVKMFIKKISSNRLFGKIHKCHLQHINDKAGDPGLAFLFFTQKNVKSLNNRKAFGETLINWILNSTFFIFYNLKKWFNGFPLFLPDRKLKITWDIVIAIKFVYFFVLIPIDIAFRN
jgi:hypothetical protein